MRVTWGHAVRAVVGAAVVSGCLAADPETGGGTGAKKAQTADAIEQVSTAPDRLDPRVLADRSFGEAPMLADRVARGELPPVGERVPERPLVIRPLEETGRYGGRLRRALTGDIVQTPGVAKTMRENLMGFVRPVATGIEVSLAESYRFEDGGRTAFFRLRKGTKWSDGMPFTVDDILFYYYDMLLDEDARNSPTLPNVWLAAGTVIQMAKVDDHTLKVMSERPLGRILTTFCGDNIAQPRHVLSTWHPRYNPEASYEDFRDRTTTAQLLYNPDVPTLSAWRPIRWDRGQRILFERNPFYWKVDTAGNQLPYADEIEFSVVQDPDVILLKFLNGEIDLFGRYSRIDQFPTLKAEERNGRFRVYLSGPTSGPAFYLNWESPNPNLAKAFSDIRVRVAMSHAINRDEINQVLFHGLLRPMGYSYGPLNPYFSEEAAQMYAAFDPVKANQLLDDAGYVDRDGDGLREFEDGSPFEFTLDVTASMGSDVSELVAAQWRAVGLKTNLNVGLRDIIFPRRVNGEYDVHYWVHLGPADPFAHLNSWSIGGPTLPFWYRSASKKAPDWLADVSRHVDSAFTTVDSTALARHMIRIRDLHTEHAAAIVVGAPYHVWGAHVRLGNVPRDLSPLNEHRGWGRPVFHEQLYIRDE